MIVMNCKECAGRAFAGSGHPVLCQNLIHLQRYKRTVDAAWAVRPATTIEQSYPLDGSSPCR